MLEKIANMLNDREYGDEITEEIRQLAKDNGIVIVYGASDDLCEFGGVWEDEVSLGYCNSGNIYITPSGLFKKPDICNCGNIENCPLLENNFFIEAVWCDPEVPDCAWSYKTKIPHEPFLIFDDGEPYCRGIVFYAKDAIA